MELAVVLVIIGLIVGGILVGRDMIRGSELQSVLTDVDKYKTAVNIFESRYNAMPGDLSTATGYWSGTTNGNGNGVIDYNGGAVSGSEEYLAWQHLALAGLIPGSATKYNNTVSALPQSKLNNGYYRMSYQQGILQSGAYTGVYGRFGHMISINAWSTSSGLANAAILSAKDVTSLDQKADDGFAPTGNIMGFNQQGAGGGCVSNDYTVTAGPWTYISSSDNVKCKIFFVLPEQ